MKFRHPGLVKAAALAAAWGVGQWLGTLRYRYRALGPPVEPDQRRLEGRYIYAPWHEHLLWGTYRYAQPGICLLISRHADGDILADVGRVWGLRAVRGSSMRGGVAALRKLLGEGKQCHLAITPDGPRGPRRRVQPGIVYVASRTGLSIVPMGIGYERAWRLPTWDRMALPWPGTLATCVTPAPIRVPPDAGKKELEHYRRLLERSLHEVTALAEGWAERGVWRGPAGGKREQRGGWEGERLGNAG